MNNLKTALLVLTLVTPVMAEVPSEGNHQGKRYNVLFIAIDDLNDWVGCMGGNDQAIMPHLDRFAKEQAMVMNKAYCPSTVCCPTRTALLTGRRPSSTGVYGNGQNLKNAAKAKDVVTLPEYFGKHGYRTVSAGKIFHKHETASGLDEGNGRFRSLIIPAVATRECYGSRRLRRSMASRQVALILPGVLARRLWKKPKTMSPANGLPINSRETSTANHSSDRMIAFCWPIKPTCTKKPSVLILQISATSIIALACCSMPSKQASIPTTRSSCYGVTTAGT